MLINEGQNWEWNLFLNIVGDLILYTIQKEKISVNFMRKKQKQTLHTKNKYQCI